MKTYLLKNSGNFYKANLHCHSSCSDGKLTPAEIKAAYKEKGYSIVAFSDHDALHSHNELSDPSFLALTAYEISIRTDDETPHAYRKIVDLNLLAKEPNNLTQIAYHPYTVSWLVERGKMTQQEVDAIQYAGDLRDLRYYPGNINKIIKTANENGFLVTVNHPMWSLAIGDHSQYEGAWAMEIYNHGCYALNGLPSADMVYDDMLRSGKKLFCVATDDNHSWMPMDSYRSDMFGGFVMIRAESLTYKNIIAALENGDFYSSTGPEISELYYEDSFVHITCSAAESICMTTLGRKGERISTDDGSPVTSAKFKIHPTEYGYVRFCVIDHNGKKAWTNAYYVEDFEPTATPRHVII